MPVRTAIGKQTSLRCASLYPVKTEKQTVPDVQRNVVLGVAFSKSSLLAADSRHTLDNNPQQ